MSNHHHLGCYDKAGNYPAFIAHLHKMVAKVMNAHWGRWENLWSSEQTSVVELIEPHDVFDKMIYALTNPVKDHLVTESRHWPGASSLVAQLHDKELTIRRPHWFFAKDGRMPKEVTLRFTRPRGFEHLSHDDWVKRVRESIAVVEARATAERRRKKLRVLGRKRVLSQSPLASPTSPARRRKLSPRVAAKNRWRRFEALRRNDAWLQAYRSALDAYRRGNKEALFPIGTYKLRIERHVRCVEQAGA